MTMIQTMTHHSGIRTVGKRIELLFRDVQWDEEHRETLEAMQEEIIAQKGQFISLDLADPMMESVWETLYVSLKETLGAQSLPLNLPLFLKSHSHTPPPFINRAICWQRLCDLLLLDEDPDRETVLVLENIDLASDAMQHDLARLIRFHESHVIRRTFVLTLGSYAYDQISSELRGLF